MFCVKVCRAYGRIASFVNIITDFGKKTKQIENFYEKRQSKQRSIMSETNQFEFLWKRISETLQSTLSPITYNTYISKLAPVDMDGTKIILSTDNEFFANFIGKNLTEKMKEAFRYAKAVQDKKAEGRPVEELLNEL